jgi:hypothetical protein
MLETPTQPAEAIQAPPPEFCANLAPDWVIEWLINILPNGGRYRGRLLLRESVRCVSARVEYPISKLRPAVVTEVPLPAETVGLLREILRTSFPDALAKLPWMCCDGIPTEIVVHRCHPYQGIRTFCNIGDAMQFLSLRGKTLVERWLAGTQSGEHAPQ